MKKTKQEDAQFIVLDVGRYERGQAIFCSRALNVTGWDEDTATNRGFNDSVAGSIIRYGWEGTDGEALALLEVDEHNTGVVFVCGHIGEGEWGVTSFANLEGSGIRETLQTLGDFLRWADEVVKNANGDNDALNVGTLADCVRAWSDSLL